MSTAPAPAPDTARTAEPTPAPSALGRIAAALTYRDFRVLWFGAFLSTIGTWMQKVAQNWLVLTITGTSSAFFLGLDSFLGELPILLLTLVGGVVADRYDRRRLLLTSQYIQMGCGVHAGGARVFQDVVHIWHVLALSVVTGLAQAFGGPAYQSLLPSLVSKDHVPNAIAFNSIQFNLARVIGPLLAGAALAAFGMVACFGLNGLSFLAVIAAILSLHVRHIPPTAPTRMREEFKSGFEYVREHPALLGLAVLGFAGTFLGNPLLTFLPLFAQNVFHGEVTQYTYLMSSAGAGAVTGALVVAWRGRFPHMGRTVLLMQIVFGVLIDAVRDDAPVLAERRPAVWRRRMHGDGVRDAVVARSAQCAERDARPRDEHLHGGVPRRDAARQPRRRLARQLRGRTNGPHGEWTAPQRRRRRLPGQESQDTRALKREYVTGRRGRRCEGPSAEVRESEGRIEARETGPHSRTVAVHRRTPHCRPIGPQDLSYLADPKTNPTDRSIGLYDVP